MDDDSISGSYFFSPSVPSIVGGELSQIFPWDPYCSLGKPKLSSKLHQDSLVNPFFEVHEGIDDQRQLSRHDLKEFLPS
tara:strand:- start:56 stop:292 length:237 start_codon:yes stop_codon:yes gene_type:complete